MDSPKHLKANPRKSSTPVQPANPRSVEVQVMPWLAAPLHQALHQLKGQALLIIAPPGAGALELSITLAQTWLCLTPRATGPCGGCSSCHWVSSRSHPDLLCLLPEALQESMGWLGETPETQDRASKAKPSQDIKVDAVQAAINFAQTTSSQDQGKVIVIHPAERLNLIAANALLKTLEEPPLGVRFILSCTAAQALLPTLSSRCQRLAVDFPTRSEALHWLNQQAIAQPEVLLAATGGLPLAARQWAAQGLTAQVWQTLPQAVMNGEPGSHLASWSVARWVDGLQKLCHDAMCVAVSGEPRFFPLAVVPRGASLPVLSAWSRDLQRLARHAEHPWSQALAIEALLQQARQALASNNAPR